MKRSNLILVTITVLFAVVVSTWSFGQTTTKLTDPEIAYIAVTANQIDINVAKIAKEKSKNADVLKFADMMITDHQSVIDQATALCKKLGITPMDNATSKKLNSDAEATMKTLRGKSGMDFDKAYINHEVDSHKAVINMVDNTLIPQTQNAELKALLVKVSPILKTHLEHAQMLQKKQTTMPPK